MIVLALLLAVVQPAARPASPPTLTLFAQPFYRGNSVTYTMDEGDVRPGFGPHSVKAVGRWLVCSEPRFKGRCIELAADYPVDAALGLNFNIRSVRGLQAGSGAAMPPPGVAPGGPSLAGTNARFFAAPRFDGERALACPTGAPEVRCAKRTAEDLCRRAGYRNATNFILESERGLYYLADLLCTRP